MAFTDKEIKEKTIGELYSETKLAPELLEEISKTDNETIDKVIDAKYSLKDENEQESVSYKLQEAYDNIIELLREYCDLKEEYYNIITLWIIGTYFHREFPSYAYLYFNAMKGSGKSRTMSLVITLSDKGQMLNALTEAVLFRTKGTLGIDEFEGMERKGGEALKELLNSGYKKGTKVKRMRKKKSIDGEELVVEEFDVYRPIVMANISGIENVLEDRCIPIILERSSKIEITNLIEIFDTDIRTIKTKEILASLIKSDEKSVVSVNVVTSGNLYKRWNEYVKSSNTNYTNYTNNINNINNINHTQLFETIKFSGINGRDLEICIPILIIANLFGGVVLKETTLTLQKIMSDKKDDNFSENKDIMLIDYVSQLPENTNFKTINSIVKEFKEFTQMNEEWVNNRWMGRALKRLNLIVNKRRQSGGMEVTLNITKAQDKIKMFKK